MKRLPKLTILLTVMLSLAACGGGEAWQSGQGETPDEQQNPPVTESAATEQTNAEDDAAQDERSDDSEASAGNAGTSVTTLDGEQVNIGGGEATALFFMAGW